jgi:transposase InsO family protein
MDLITDLPKSHGFNSILTIVDHGTSRAALFLPCNKTITGAGIAKLYYKHVYRWFGTSTRMISDRDPQFTSHFGQALTKQLDIKRNLSTAFHLQTNGLSEQTNQWVEQYLRLITAHDQKNWSQWLPLATTVHNNKRNASLGFVPNKVLWGQSMRLLPNSDKLTPNQTVEERITELQW